MFDSVPVELYRVAELNDDFVPASMVMEEGVNTTRILYNPIEYTAGTGDIEGESLSYWKDFVDGTSTSVSETYGRIDNSRKFFDGRDVAEDFVSVYVETNLEAIDDLELLFKSCKKADENSRAWAVKVYLNGVQVADMPVGEDEAVIPWKFNKGLNQIILLITIPEANNANPYITQGQIDLMAPNNLFDYGAVKLGTWTYADPFAVQYNEQGSPMTFTVYERNIAGGAKRKEIVSRRAPKDNLRLKYTRPSGTAPSAVRLRADLSRKASNPNVSPKLDLYRLRFLYG